MTDEQIRQIQIIMAPIFGVEPEDILLGGYQDGSEAQSLFVYSRKQPERLSEKVHEWKVECDSPNMRNT